MPFSTAFLRILLASIPLPSSVTMMTTLLPSWRAISPTSPVRGLPLASRSSGCSTPWSRELRRRCIIGSPISSITVRSSSVSSPSMVRLISLFNSLDTSRTIRGKRLNTALTGTMRTFMTMFCRSVVTRSICSSVSVSSPRRCAWPICSRRTLLITSSPIRFIRVSSLSISTRTDWL